MKSRILRLLGDLWSLACRRNSVAVTYFNEELNVGDLIGPYLVEKISRCDVHRAQTNLFPRLLTVGSVLESATNNSSVWGSGSIDGSSRINKLNPNKIYAVRGKMTLSKIRQTLPISPDLPLGDPALLMPLFYSPVVRKKHDIGIVPHYSDLSLVEQLAFEAKTKVNIIDVRSEPEVFIERMLACRRVISSSLHGLILADAYGVPNVWAKFSDRLVGGDWKFRDYYSVTDAINPAPTVILSGVDLVRAINSVPNTSQIAKYQGSLELLLDAFPLERPHRSGPPFGI